MTEPTPEGGITFLRSTTKTTIDREADGDTTTRVEHIARFAVRDGALPDLAGTRTAKFEPNWLEATWVDGQLIRAHTTGPMRLKSGATSEKVTHRHSWGRWSDRILDRANLPIVIQRALADYERMVAVAASGGDK